MDDRWEHYFTSRPETSGDERLITARLRGYEFRFWTDAGVFSRRGIDFGTRLLIETVRLPETGEILDLGCGYGPVGIACAKAAPSCRVTMVDVNQRALRLAEKNARLNGVSARVTILESDGLCALSDRLFDAVLINPPIRAGKAVVYRLFAEAAEHLQARRLPLGGDSQKAGGRIREAGTGETFSERHPRRAEERILDPEGGPVREERPPRSG